MSEPARFDPVTGDRLNPEPIAPESAPTTPINPPAAPESAPTTNDAPQKSARK